ncbi:Lrp/AsnC ligand binding domain-containing protein [Plantactinospora soyae]|uniref:DNA-binding Lrp family transcriptional regulator n=1 Tax=Plantactinospora soyae TaxID=1544732 RepID=A0A927R307_9ACTN|nr:Lrp/AsnC ligand binding domain-containing protein [Plantactinospora soyae]MBE1491338.1 DNA-binding Lrp family transcriptional regulator [Plantactinospora soyae]
MTTNEPESLSVVQALVFVRLPGPDRAGFRRFLTGEPSVRAAWQVVGDIDLVLHVSCQDLPELDRLITTMRIRGGASATSTHLVIGTAEQHPGEPLPVEARSTKQSGTVGRRRSASRGRGLGDLPVAARAGR